MTQNRVKYLPTSYLWFPPSAAITPIPRNKACFPDSNGNASGACYEEAVLQGLLEVIERDAVAIWWYNRLPRPQLDLDNLNDPYFNDLCAEYQKLGRRIWLLDLTSDLAVPVYAAVSCRRDTGGEILLGFGAHTDSLIAAHRAVNEVNQFLPRFRDGKIARDLLDEHALRWAETVRVHDQPHLLPSGSTSFTENNQGSLDLTGAISLLVERLAASDHQTLIVNQTRPDVDLSVVKVVVPGLRHFWARFAPGRLYTVPLKMGWLETPTGEDNLNPVHMFL